MKYAYIFFLLFFSLNAYNQICVGDAGKVTWECWQNLYDNELGELYVEENYPGKPDFKQTLYKLKSPQNFDNMMGGKISGFISVPQTDVVTFNLTGDDITRFYLSSNESPDNLSLRAYADSWSNVEEHDKYPSQTSNPITLNNNNYYYFELIYLEGYGGDHINLYWKTTNDDPNNWKIVNANFINDVGCLPNACPERGTACDDGDPQTSDDQEDGFCHCLGKQQTSNTCIGERSNIKMYRYENIPGGDLNDLYAHTSFPGVPNYSKKLEYLATPWENEVDSVGHLIQSFISVPETGNYKFNITGNNECIFFLSSDESPANKQSHQIVVTGATDPTEHNKYLWQSTSNIFLEKNNYYYIEVNHKEGSYSEHFSVFWQTPFTEPGVWKRIPEFYFYDFECETACIPQNTSCDDGDPFTNNDMYNGSCECVGTPCIGTECDDPLASYSSYDKCDFTDDLDNRSDNNWLSCTKSANPNSLRSNSHWIMYDFGQVYVMNNSHVWNYNEATNFSLGFENVAIDYSIDGVNWQTFSTQTWPQSSGDSNYSGFIGPNFNGLFAQYILITSLDSGNSCRGFGKLLIDAQYCQNQGITCDDNNPFTLNDVIDFDCQCRGTDTAFNDCLVDSLSLGDTVLISNVYSAKDLIDSENIINASSNYVLYISGKEIDLNPGFETTLGSNFEAFIEQCNSPANSDEDIILKNVKKEDILRVIPEAESDYQIIEFVVEKPGKVILDIASKKGDQLFHILNADFRNKGIYQKRIRTTKFTSRTYNVHLKTESSKEKEILTVQ